MLLSLFFLFLVAQALTGWHELNKTLQEKGMALLSFPSYLHSGHFLQATFENWESEFLQMFAYVWMTVYFRQIGSSESKPLNEQVEVDRIPKNHKQAPWPVKKGGWILQLYKHSLGLAFLLLFLLSFILHAYGSYKAYRFDQLLEGRNIESFFSYIAGSRFWFESFQNWQSEFLAVAAIVILSIFLRHQGSPESKPVDASNEENE